MDNKKLLAKSTFAVPTVHAPTVLVVSALLAIQEIKHLSSTRPPHSGPRSYEVTQLTGQTDKVSDDPSLPVNKNDGHQW